MLPCPKNDSVLSPREFRNGLANRYQKPLLQMPGTCDGCGALFSLEHGLNCANGGNLIRRHNEVGDVTGQLAALAFPHVTKEPVVRHGSGDEDGLICDLPARRWPAYAWTMEQPCPSCLSDSSKAYYYSYSPLLSVVFLFLIYIQKRIT